MTAGSVVAPLRVTVVADRSETIAGLRAYFQSVGVASNATRTLGHAASLESNVIAFVLFPDDFDPGAVVREISQLRANQPRLLIVVVTNLAQRLHPALDPDGHSLLPVVLSRPAFGWAILDVIRAHAQAETPD